RPSDYRRNRVCPEPGARAGRPDTVASSSHLGLLSDRRRPPSPCRTAHLLGTRGAAVQRFDHPAGRGDDELLLEHPYDSLTWSPRPGDPRQAVPATSNLSPVRPISAQPDLDATRAPAPATCPRRTSVPGPADPARPRRRR